MAVFLILAPYGVFAALMLVTSATVSLFTSAAICLAVIAFDVVRGRSVKILGAGSVIAVRRCRRLSRPHRSLPEHFSRQDSRSMPAFFWSR